MIIDTHCHLYLPEFSNEIDIFINSAKENGIKKIYLPAINSESTEALLSLEEKHLDICGLCSQKLTVYTKSHKNIPFVDNKLYDNTFCK